MVKKTVLQNKIKAACPRKATQKGNVKKTDKVAMPRLALNHNQIVL